MKNGKHSTNYAPIPSDTKEDVLIKLNIVKFREVLTLTLNSLELSLEFLDEQNLFDKINRIDYILYLIGFFVYSPYTTLNSVPEQVKAELNSWVCTVKFNNQSNSARRSIYNELLDKASS